MLAREAKALDDDEYAIYVWADSSEQADYDILMSTLLLIKVQDLATVFSLAKELALLQIDVKQMEANSWEKLGLDLTEAVRVGFDASSFPDDIDRDPDNDGKRQGQRRTQAAWSSSLLVPPHARAANLQPEVVRSERRELHN